jgi:metal-sulfur cluster biosynthetic enzyme
VTTISRSPSGPETVEAAIRLTLNEIIDPCSAAAGCPAGLVDMGLVRQLNVSSTETSGSPEFNVSVTLAITHPFCMMSTVFVNEAQTRIAELFANESGFGTLAACTVELDAGYVWTDDDFSPEYAARRRISLLERGILVEGEQP